jgi:hypothetical protein
MFDISVSYAGQTDVNPNIVKITTSDSYDVITTAGWLVPANIAPIYVNPLDILFINYNYNVTANPQANFGIFRAVYTNGVITLEPESGTGSVKLPVVSGHFANFQGTTGMIGDNGFVPSSSSLTQVTMGHAGSYTPGNILVAYDAFGSSGPGIGVPATQINSPITATPSNIPMQMGLNLTAPSITSGYAYGSNSFVSFTANAGGDLAGSSSTITGTGALGATSVTSGHESILNVSGMTMTSGAVLAAFNAVFNASSAVTGATDQYALISSKGPATGSLGCLINYQGKAGNFLNTVASSPMVGTPSGLTPSGLFASLFIEIGGVQYQIPCATILS